MRWTKCFPLNILSPLADVRNRSIFVAIGRRGYFGVCAAELPVSLDFFVPNAACLFPRKSFGESGHSLDNITDWALEQFRARYEKDKKPKRQSSKTPSSTMSMVSYTIPPIAKICTKPQA